MNSYSIKPSVFRNNFGHKTKQYASCTGGFCNLDYKHGSGKTFLSKGEGIPPPLKKKNIDFAVYKLSYPHDKMIEPETYGPMILIWAGRRWYSSP